jgi:hypothetical protein
MGRVCPFDLAKLRALTLPKLAKVDFGYQLGAFVHFSKLGPQFLWLVNGETYQSDRLIPTRPCRMPNPSPKYWPA